MLPVMVILMLFVGATIYLVNQNITSQYKGDGAEALLTSQRVFEKFMGIRKEQLALRGRSIPNDHRISDLLTSDYVDLAPLRLSLNQLVLELNLSFISFTDARQRMMASATQISNLDAEEYNRKHTRHIERALEGETVTTLADMGGMIVEIATTPIIKDGQVVGALTIGNHLDEAVISEFKRLTSCEIVFYSGKRASVTSWQDAAKRLSFYGAVNSPAFPFDLGEQPLVQPMQELRVNGEHYYGMVSTCAIPNESDPVRYSLLSSYENRYQELVKTQQYLLRLGVLGVWLGGWIAYIMVGRVVRPLKELKRSAEQIGDGDLTHRVKVRSKDEIGDLANTFNQMCGKIQHSRDELQHTVAKLKDTKIRLVQSEKLSALGAFIAGITHELNNPLTVMIGYAQLLKESDLSPEHLDDVDQIISSADRCHAIIQNLLSFARERPAERVLVSLNDIVNNTLKFVFYELRTANVTINKELGDELQPILGDPYQLQQVLLNIIKNAEHAMDGQSHPAILTIRTSREAGGINRLTVQDSGPGIPPGLMHKIFDPFFTTKPPGKGTGLGLSMSYGIIREHGGEITAESPPDQGTRFVIDLPETPINAAMLADLGNRPKLEQANYQGAGQKILVVDDEELILNLTRKILGRCGYEVHTTGNGLEALHRLEREHFDLVLSDWRMPGMSGQEFFEQWLEKHPSSRTRFIFMSGDVLNEDMQRYIERNGSACLLKPFSLDDFRAVMQTITLQHPS
ncbi:MAG: two-component system NtrC family sensor kinase [Kiritimatiellia bacterium]|jgi:two-component system NtrC family sensor kinase